MRRLIQFINEAPWKGEPSDERFSEIAIDSFRRQCERIPEYGAYARHVGRAPDQTRDWRDIPPVPVSAFRSHDLSAAQPSHDSLIFETSGTTISRPGQVRLGNTVPYENSLVRNFDRHLLPDGVRLPLIVFGPPRLEAPRSSLWFMADWVATILSSGGLWIVKDGWVRLEVADQTLARAVRDNRPVLLFGTTLLFEAYFVHCRRERIHYALPEGSRAMDTGGSKGTRVEVSRPEVHAAFEEILGIPRTHLVNEYGMAEMGSQFYEDSLLAFHEDRRARPGFEIPPWVRTRVLDPETMRECPEGRSGVLVHYDLANIDTPLAIQTEDVGSVSGGRLLLEGRLPEAERRGCSLPFEQFLEKERARS